MYFQNEIRSMNKYEVGFERAGSNVNGGYRLLSGLGANIFWDFGTFFNFT